MHIHTHTQSSVRPMTTAQEAGTAGGGILGRMPGGGFQQPHHMQQPAGGQGMTQVSEVVTILLCGSTCERTTSHRSLIHSINN